MIGIADTSSLSYLVRLRSEFLLPRLFDRIVVPPAVLSELRAPGSPAAIGEFLKILPPWLDVLAVDVEISIANHRGLHRGEREVIAVALQLAGSIAILDDMAARKYAASHGVAITGTIGILMRAAAEGWLNLEQSLNELERAGFYMGDSLKRAALEGKR